jgi:hypothetical protein
MTTAQYRTLAVDAEANLNWTAAARLWTLAIENYPGNRASALAKLDLSKMENRASAAKAMAA